MVESYLLAKIRGQNYQRGWWSTPEAVVNPLWKNAKLELRLKILTLPDLSPVKASFPGQGISLFDEGQSVAEWLSLRLEVV